MSAQAAARVEAIFRESGAYREGHFQLKSGRHADRYVEKFEVLQWPERVTELVGLMVEPVRISGVDVVIGPTVGGVILAYEAARQLGVRGIFAEQVAHDGGELRRELRRGFAIAPGERVLLVDDVVTTGASLVEMLPVIEAFGGDLRLVSVLVDRSGGVSAVSAPAGARSYPVSALWSLTLPTFEPGPDHCPGCAAGLSLKTPGSSGTKVQA